MTPGELKKWREKMNLSQVELAKILGVHVITLARWETDARPIPTFLHLALEALEGRRGLASKRKSK